MCRFTRGGSRKRVFERSLVGWIMKGHDKNAYLFDLDTLWLLVGIWCLIISGSPPQSLATLAWRTPKTKMW